MGEEREPIVDAVLALLGGGRSDRVAVTVARRVADLFEPHVRWVRPKRGAERRRSYEVFYRLRPHVGGGSESDG